MIVNKTRMSSFRLLVSETNMTKCVAFQLINKYDILVFNNFPGPIREVFTKPYESSFYILFQTGTVWLFLKKHSCSH